VASRADPGEVMFCSSCGASLQPGVRFCDRCGAALAPVPQPKPKSSSCLKLFLLGCLFFIVAGIVVFTAAGYLANRWFGNIIASENSNFGRRAQQLRQSHPFEKNADGSLTDSQLVRFLAVAEKTTGVINSEEIQRETDSLQKSKNPYIDGFRFFAKFGNTWRNALLDSLEEHQMSLEEYQYIHKNALKAWAAALKQQTEQAWSNQKSENEQSPVPEIPDELKRFVDDATNVPPGNIAIIANHKADVDKFLPTAPFAKMLFPFLVEPDKDSLF
jgi:hypothetical protein